MIKLLLVLAFLGGDRIVLRKDAPVDGRFIRLLDVVEGDSLAAETRKLFQDVWLGRAPGAEESRVITIEEIQKELDRRGIEPSRFIYEGESVTVRAADPDAIRSTNAIRAQLAADIKARYLDRVRAVDKTRYAVRIKYLSEADFPQGALLAEVEPREALRIGRISFKAKLKSGMEIEGIAQIMRVVTVAFARRDLRKNHIIRAEDVVMKQMELESSDGYCTDMGLLIGGKLLDRVVSGETFSPGHIKFKPVVRRGDSVQVSNGLVSNRGTALSDGAGGDFIRVEFGTTKTVVVCRVTSAGRAKLVRGER